MKKLKKDYGLICVGEVELIILVVFMLKNIFFKKLGIVILIEKVFGVFYEKNKCVIMSNWENCDLIYV